MIAPVLYTRCVRELSNTSFGDRREGEIKVKMKVKVKVKVNMNVMVKLVKMKVNVTTNVKVKVKLVTMKPPNHYQWPGRQAGCKEKLSETDIDKRYHAEEDKAVVAQNSHVSLDACNFEDFSVRKMD
ncbi:hypothetical protein J6590_059884 [Homalodisca vitripennis]|nr:hypothetical protein J6590_059884 [Homalodisca vitripennis]